MKYKCPECGWIGTKEEMLENDFYDEDGVYITQDNICPSCYEWNELEDYEEIKENSK